MSTMQMQVTLKKAFAPVPFFSSHLVQDLISKYLEHLKAKIQYTEIFWPQIRKIPFIPCTVASAVAVVYRSKWLMLWIAFSRSAEAEHGRNSANVSHCWVCPHSMRYCAFSFHCKTNTWTEISYIKHLGSIVLSEVSK